MLSLPFAILQLPANRVRFTALASCTFLMYRFPDNITVRLRLPIGFLVLIVPVSSADAQNDGIDRALLISKTDQLIDSLLVQDRFSGVVLIGLNDETVYERAAGKANRSFSIENTPDTRLAIHSMAKMFTGVAIMQLIATDRLGLDAPLARYLPGFPDSLSSRSNLIRHLLTHTSGLSGFLSDEFFQASRDGLTTLSEMPGSSRRHLNTFTGLTPMGGPACVPLSTDTI